MNRPLYRELASTIQARAKCDKASPRNVDVEWFDRYTKRIHKLSQLLPSGSGFDNGTLLVLAASHAEKLVFETSYHHMTDSGFYDGWTEHTIVVTPSFSGINLRVSGRNRNNIKDYIYETFDHALKRDVSYEVLLERYPECAITSKWEEQNERIEMEGKVYYAPSQCYQAWYTSDGARFWNDWEGARKHAVEQMETIAYGSVQS